MNQEGTKTHFDADQMKPGGAIKNQVPGTLSVCTKGSVLHCSNRECKLPIFPGNIFFTPGYQFQDQYGGIKCNRCYTIVAIVEPGK